MTLELNKLGAQIDEMGRVLAARAKRDHGVLPEARDVLRQYAHQQELLRQLAESQAGQKLRCASPGDEPLDGAWPPPAMPDQATLIAADGSQIYPDSHGLAFYYLINVGSIIFRHGSGLAPEVATEAQLCYTEDRLYPGGMTITSEVVSVQRDLAEMRALAGLAAAEPPDGPPCLALADGPLVLWFQRPNVSEEEQAQILADYLQGLGRVQRAGATLAGFVSRPRSAEVVALLYLAGSTPEERSDIERLADTNYRGLTDRALFGTLGAGQRSALFVRGTPANRDFRARGHAIYFFYLNTGADLARVEVPEWVALEPGRLGLVHALVYDQCRFNNGYPYILTRADEQAVILGRERELLETMIVRAMIDHGLPLPELSRKAQQKQVARWRR
jgi:hypothetical protein